MTREEAWQGLQGYSMLIADGTDLKEALRMAIEALSEPSKVYYRTDKSRNIGTEVNDLISRSAEAIQGEWEHWGSPFSDESEVIDTIVCSVCGARFIEPKDEPKGEYNFCPNCGAKMIEDYNDKLMKNRG